MREPLKLTRAHDPLLAILALLALLGASLTLGTRAKTPSPPAGTTRALTMMELYLDLGPKLDAVQPGTSRKIVAEGANLTAPWDRAAWAVDAEEAGDAALADRLRTPLPDGEAGLAFARAWAAAYMEDSGEGAVLPAPLKGTRAGALLENRLRARQGLPALPLPKPPYGLLAGIGALATLLCFGGFAVAIYLLATAKRPALPQPQWRMDGRGALLVFFGWWTGFFVLNAVSGLALHRLSQGRLWSLPLGYALHAGFGLWLLMRVEGLSLAELRVRVMPPSRTGRAWLWAPAFVGLAVAAILFIALLWSPVLKGHPNPQQEVQDLLSSARGLPVQLTLFLTIAGLAPLFEELMFRGFLLPWMGARWGAGLALAASSLLFGFIHLQPWALPVLGGLGFVLGLAARRGGSLWTSIAVHGAWNGSVFLLMKAF